MTTLSPWIGRLVTATLCALGFIVLPAAAAPLNVGSGNLSNYRACTLTVRGASATEGFDTWVNQDAPTANNGTSNTMDVDASTGTKVRRVYLMFDLTACTPQIPASATVTSARLRLFLSGLPTLCRTQDVFRVGSSWTETGITWNNQPFGTTIDNPPSGERTAAMDVGKSPCENATNSVYVTGWDVTTDVAAYVAGSATNNGWMIRDDAENSASAGSTYRTKNVNSATQSPQLIVNYTS
jgi:hypothetical protein